MSDVLDKLNTLMGYRDYSEGGLYGTTPVFEEKMFDRMFEFITSLEPDQLTEEQAGEVIDIIEEMELEYEGVDEDEEFDEEEEDLNEAPRRVRRNKALKRKRSMQYRKEKSKRKRQVKLYRKSARGRLMQKKAKRMSKMGKTATGKRKRTYVN
jgi:hypothetical protein